MNGMPALDTRVASDAVTVVLAPGMGRMVLLDDLIARNIVLDDDWQNLDETTKRGIHCVTTEDQLLNELARVNLLTRFQVDQVRRGRIAGLTLGYYRLLEEIGSGGMGVVYRGEQVLLRRPVAIKVLRTPAGGEDIVLQRFFVEMQALARIRHPNIVWALDAGIVKSPGMMEEGRHYLVMEHVAGANLENLAAQKPLGVAESCKLVFQIAGALVETHKLNLVHRDIKPSNVLVTPQMKAKLLDFGLALCFGRRRLTMPGTVIGTLSYMAPEQISDAASVDIRADIFSLGATLCYALTGKPPFEAQGPVTQQVASRMFPKTPEIRKHRPDVPIELEKAILRMMAHERKERFATPESVVRALLPFVNNTSSANQFETGHCPSAEPDEPILSLSGGDAAMGLTLPQILLVDDHVGIRRVCKTYLQHAGFQVAEAPDGEDALRQIAERPFDLVLLDIDMPRLSGVDTLKRLRRDMPCGYLKIIMMSGRVSAEEMSAMLFLGADDYVAKPFSRLQILSRIKAALAHKAVQDRSDWLHQQLLRGNGELERALATTNQDMSAIRETLLHVLIQLVQSRTPETPAHLARVAQYAKALAAAARSIPRVAPMIDADYLRMVEKCAPFHDIGNLAMPDHILCPAAELGVEEQIILQAHTTIGADTLAGVAKQDRGAAVFWQMAIDIARHHHERFDGAGYPDRLAGRDIPLAARLIAIADYYDSLRMTVGAGARLEHHDAVERIVAGSRSRFDPWLVQAFQAHASEFDAIFRLFPEGKPCDTPGSTETRADSDRFVGQPIVPGVLKDHDDVSAFAHAKN